MDAERSQETSSDGGVSAGELAEQAAFALFADSIRMRFPDDFAAAGVPGDVTGSEDYFIALAEEPHARLRSQLEYSPVAMRVLYGAGLSEKELVALSGKVMGELVEILPNPEGLWVSPSVRGDGLRVHYSMHGNDEAIVQDAVAGAVKGFDTPVEVELLASKSAKYTSYATVHGGRRLQVGTSNRDCSSGFSVKRSNGAKGVVTAAHCPNNLRYRGEDGVITFGKNADNGSNGRVDMKFMRALSGHTVKPEINIRHAGTSWIRPITGSAGAATGQTVCKSGYESKYTCSVVGSGRTTAYYNGAAWQDLQMVFQPVTGVFAIGGDSGGSVFIDQTAVGTIAAGDANVVFFTWIHATAYLQGVTMVL